nr:ABC transporter ATP-binding protein/permease [Kingella oralis]
MALLKQFLRLAHPFWAGKNQWREWLLLAAVIGFTLFSIFMSVKIAAWDKRFYDALAAFDGKAMPALIVEYCGYMGLIIGCIVCGDWLQKRLIFRWRTHLTERFQSDWLGGHKHYRLQLTGEPDNPDQRIADDIYQLADKSIVLFRSFINNVAKFSAFVAVLWGLSGVQHFTLLGREFTVYGYLVWVALIYSAVSTLIAHLVGRKLKDLNIDRQHREADFRAALLRVRDHSEQVAFYQGADAEQGRLKQRYRQIRDNWFRLTNCEFRQETFWATYVRISIFIPILATLPMYLAKTLTFGDMMQTRTSFARVQDSFGWFTDSYRRLVEWAAVVERLGGFQAALDRVQRQPENACSHSQAVPSPAPAQEREQRADGIKGSLKSPMQPENRPVLMLNQTTVHTPAGGMMLQAVSLEASAPEWLLLEGRSGIGKSTLLRVLAGLWPYHGGHFDINGSFLFIPQRPYLPHGSLRDTISYPHPCRLADDTLRDILQHVGLGSLKNRLDEAAEWHSRLSGGEQQRLSLARALAARPQILFLDEATNQLDDESALALMRMLKTELPDTLVVGISHQSGVKVLFDRRITLQRAKAA